MNIDSRNYCALDNTLRINPSLNIASANRTILGLSKSVTSVPVSNPTRNLILWYICSANPQPVLTFFAGSQKIL